MQIFITVVVLKTTTTYSEVLGTEKLKVFTTLCCSQCSKSLWWPLTVQKLTCSCVCVCVWHARVCARMCCVYPHACVCGVLCVWVYIVKRCKCIYYKLCSFLLLSFLWFLVCVPFLFWAVKATELTVTVWAQMLTIVFFKVCIYL